jgi:hypothetical protein
MEEAKGCTTRRRQGQGITITVGTMTTTIIIIIGISITIGITILVTVTVGLTTGFHCCATMTPGHAGCLPPRKKRQTGRQTDMDGPIRFTSFTLERE